MSKTILHIENDAPFAEEITSALEAMGFKVRVTGDGKDGLDLARDLNPDAIVLCVELPKLSGYSICNKLKKDEALKSIPLILTSSEATTEVFDDHKKLKVRAEDYLIKPYVPAALLEKLVALIGMPEGGVPLEASAAAAGAPGVDAGEEEVVSLEEELGLEPFSGDSGQELPALDLDSLPDEPAAAVVGDDLDDDLKLLDDAFDGLSAPAAPRPEERSAPAATLPDRTAEVDATAADQAIEKAMGVDRPVTSEDLEAASASLPEDDEAGARADLGRLGDDADLMLGSLDDTSPTPSAFDALAALDELDEPPPARTHGPASEAHADAAGAMAAFTEKTVDEEAPGLAAVTAVASAAAVAAVAASVSSVSSGAGAAELARLEAELVERRAALHARETELGELRSKLEAAARRSEEADAAISERDAEVSSLQARAETLAAQSRRTEADSKAAREEARRANEQAQEAEARAEGAAARAATAESRAVAAEARSRAAESDAAAQRRAAELSAVALAARSAELAAAQAAALRLAEVERDVERLETELVVARGEVEGARTEVEKRVAELKRRIAELEAANTKNEERVVKAYLKIKGDEKVRDKARKALSIALQLLEEGLPAEQAGDKRPRPIPPPPVPE